MTDRLLPSVPDMVRRRAAAAAERLLTRTRPPESAAVPALAMEPTKAQGPAAVLDALFADFGLDARVVGRTVGPAVTCYHVQPGSAIKVEKVAALLKTVESRLESPSVRIVHVVPGAGGVMGVEVPNLRRSIVALPDLLVAAQGDEPLLVALGADTAGHPVYIDVATLPHLLVAGETGAGKSSVINSVVCSVLSRVTPDDVRLLLIDPKRVELAPYGGIPHLVTPIVTSPEKAVKALAWVCDEMDDRFERFQDLGVRNIAEHNRRVPAADRMARLLIVVDELADLMIVAKKEVETSVVRIAQLARAAGIHLVLATQRPSVDVVTGLIKANMPSRLALTTASAVDSTTIIDVGGAEKLLSLGDALLKAPGLQGLLRLQCAWVTDDEIAEVVAVAKSLPGHAPKAVVTAAEAATTTGAGEDVGLLKQAIELVVGSQFGSTNMLQRKLRVGWAKAGALMDRMEELGVVGRADGSKARDVLVKPDDLPAALARLRTT